MSSRNGYVPAPLRDEEELKIMRWSARDAHERAP